MNQSHSSLFCLPGLGTDERIFSRLNLNSSPQYLNWIEPNTNEELSDYAKRIAQPLMGINLPILVGVSFGAILALEISRFKNLGGVIILSGVKSSSEKPISFKIMKLFPFYKLTKGNWRIKTIPLWSPSFGITSKEEQKLLKDIFSQFSDQYRMWAIQTVSHWEGGEFDCKQYHIHGSRDKVFPISRIKKAKIVEGGTHFMVYQRAEEVSDLINQKVGEWRSEPEVFDSLL